MTYERTVMTRKDSTADRLHQAMHRLPGIPSHEHAWELNANESGRARAARLNAGVNAAGRARAARWNSNAAAERVHAKPPRVFAGLQEFIARRVGRVE
jgi:hypothetical protein